MPKTGKIWDLNHRKPFVNQQEIDIDVSDGDIERGQSLFSEHCGGCHGMDQNNPRGSNLFRQIYNNELGYTLNFDMVGGMAQARGLIWTPKMLYYFLENPENLIKDSMMQFHGVPDPYDRACIIEYLHFLRVKTV